MLPSLKRLTRKRKHVYDRRRRRIARTLERLENRQLLAADVQLSTYFGSAEFDDGVGEIAQDAAGNAYVTSYEATDPVTYEFESFLRKVSPDGDVVWSQVLDEYAYNVAVDSQGFVYLASLTQQDGLSVTADAHQAGRAGDFDLYLTVLDGNAIDSDPSTLSTDELVYASYLGGSGSEEAFPIDLTVDDQRGIYLTTRTDSADFPTTNQASVDDSYGGSFDATLSYFSFDNGYSLDYSTYVGGSGIERGVSIDTDDSGLIHFAVVTDSADLTTTPDAASATLIGSRSVYLARMTTSGDLEYGSYVGTRTDDGVDIAATPDGSTYLFGKAGDGYPVTDGAYRTDIKTFPYQGSVASSYGNYVSLIDSDGDLAASTRFHINDDVIFLSPADIELDGDELVIAGSEKYLNPAGNVHLLRFDADLSTLLDSISIGGSNADDWYGMSNVVNGEFYFGGFTRSEDFPTTPGAPDASFGGVTDGFLVRYALSDSAETSVSDVSLSEGNTSRTATVVLSLAEAWSTDLSVDYQTIDGTAVAGEDYVATSGTLVIPAGSTSAAIDVTIVGDSLAESDESFTVELTNLDGIGVNSTTPKVTIINDDFSTFDDFDNGTPDGGTGAWLDEWELTNNSAFVTNSGPNDGTLHAIIQRRGSLTRTVDTAGVTDLNLSFASKLRSFENKDKAYVRVSPDGSNWTTLKTFGNGEDDNTYRDYSFDIPFDADTLWIRFEGGMSSRSADYWYVDTVSVTGEVIVTDPSPTASDDSYAVMEDGTLSIGAAGVLNNDSDPEGQSLTANLISGPGNGTLTLNPDGSFNYTPDADFDGTDQFTYAANDGISDSAAATVTIEVAPVNDAPVAFDDSFAVDQDTVLVVPANGLLANDGDVDGDALSIQPWSGPSDQGGQVTVNANGSFTYTPPSGFTGIDSFEYAASDGTLQSALATVMIEVAEANDNAIYVYDIQFDSRYWGWQRRAVFHVRSDSNFDGQGNSADQKAAGVEITVRFAGRTYSGVTDSNGLFRTGWIWNPGSGTYADVVDLALTDYTWDPLALDLEDDSNGDGLPDARL
ncbi:tandem-95 repeat protein [Crateriforma spongiae]|uniref:tandem-95 repeat protein n=1 Tax=Crateriforma spongiae TaxID=2724528 RepID=UPI00144537F6|nr:tandem-95 repeat protein [Crateriforma spongiae]